MSNKKKEEKPKKETKKRADKYESKLKINGSFEDVLKASLNKKD